MVLCAIRGRISVKKRDKQKAKISRLYDDRRWSPSGLDETRHRLPAVHIPHKELRPFRQVIENKRYTMHILAALVGLFSAAAALAGLKAGDSIVLLLAGWIFVRLYHLPGADDLNLSANLRGDFAAETVIFGIIFLIDQIGLWPPSLEDYAFPESLPLTVALSPSSSTRSPIFRSSNRSPASPTAISTREMRPAPASGHFRLSAQARRASLSAWWFSLSCSIRWKSA